MREIDLHKQKQSKLSKKKQKLKIITCEYIHSKTQNKIKVRHVINIINMLILENRYIIIIDKNND